MDISKFLSKALGVYLVVISASMAVNLQTFMTYVSEFVSDMPLMLITGIFTLILGVLMVVSHNIWQWHWRLIVTLLAWLTFLKGASILFYPNFIEMSADLFFKNVTVAYSFAGFDFLLGLVLCYFGFKSSS